ncbi:hypothetical protein ABIE67_008984 [Streptomyces sp. V4I8]|uniref:hypothetical protein n=1 Tax=Streptomyces sp. V4I8 TaxID=3156469 RepID=UPI003516FF8B
MRGPGRDGRETHQETCRSGAMNLLPVEVKVNIESDVPAALTALRGSRGAMVTRRIWFAEDRDGVADGRVLLLDGGVIVRFRIGGAADDLTVKLRPCTREQLVGRFSARFDAEAFTYKIEEDWSGNRRVLAASLAHGHPPGALSGGGCSPGLIRVRRSTRCRTSSCMPARPPSESTGWWRWGRSSR